MRVYDAAGYHAARTKDARLIVGYTAVDINDIERGIRILADVVKENR